MSLPRASASFTASSRSTSGVPFKGPGVSPAHVPNPAAAISGVTFCVVGKQRVRAVPGQHTHQFDVTVLGGQVKRRCTNKADVVAAHSNIRWTLHLSVIAIERNLLPGDSNVGIRAVLQQRFGQAQAVEGAGHLWRSRISSGRSGLSNPRQRMKNRAARVRYIRIGSVVEQQSCDLEIRVNHRHGQSRRGICYRFGCRIRRDGGCLGDVVDAGLCVQQAAHGRRRSLTDRKQQGRETSFRTCLDVRSRFEQGVDNRRVPLGCRPHQRGLPPPALHGVDIGAAHEQRFYRAKTAGAGGAHQAGFTFGEGGVRIGAGLKQLLDNFRISPRTRDGDRRDAIAVDRFQIGAGPDQASDLGGIAALDRAMKRGTAGCGLRTRGRLRGRDRGHRQEHSTKVDAGVKKSRHRVLLIVEGTRIHATGTFIESATTIAPITVRTQDVGVSAVAPYT